MTARSAGWGVLVFTITGALDCREEEEVSGPLTVVMPEWAPEQKPGKRATEPGSAVLDKSKSQTVFGEGFMS